MPYNGSDKLYIKVELLIDGVYVEVTSRARGGRAASGVKIERGRDTGALQAQASTCELTLGNVDAWVTEGNPESPWYPYVGRGCRMRVSLSGILPSDVVRFEGEIDTMVAVYPGGPDSSMRITATADLGGRLGLGSEPLDSPLYRSMSGESASGCTADEYWSLEDGAEAEQFASAVGGAPMVVRTGVVPSTDSTLPGSLALPELTEAANVSAGATVRSYTDQGQWVAQFMARVPDDGGPTFNTLLTATLSPAVSRYVQVGVGPSGLILQIYSDAGADSGGWAAAFDTSLVYGQWVSFVLAAEDDASGTTDRMSVSMYDTNGDLLATISQLVGVGYYGTVRRFDLNGVSGVGGGAGEAHYGHLGFYTDPAWTVGADDVFNARAAGGWVGELVHERMERLCREEGITITITGTSAQAMGPQRVDTLANLLIDGEDVDGGQLSDGGGDGVAYRCLSTIVNQPASLAVTRGSLDTDVAPMWDNRNIRNDITVSRPNGSSARRSDEAHVARTRRRILDSPSANVQTDEQLPDQAGWRVNIGTADGPRYNGVGINLRNVDGARLADAVLVLEAGDRFTVAAAAMPLQHPPGGIDGLVVGWSEHLDSTEWTFAPNVVPYAPYLVAELDDNDSAKLDTAGTIMHTAATSGATSFTVATTVPPKWTTDAGEMPIPILVSGQVNSVTAISNVSPSFVAAGTAAHATNASVTPSMPAGVQAGDLLLVFAAIRNSGTGSPNTPSGYTLLRNLTGDVTQPRNAAVYAKIHTGTESAPTVSFTGGAANADTSAQMAAFRGVGITIHASTAQLNSSAQDIAYPAMDISRDNCVVIYAGWKQDDWTSVASPGTEIGEPDTTTGDDQGIVWAYTIQTAAAAIAAGSFTVTGGASAISRSAVIALATDVQTMTVTRGVNGVTKAIPISSQVNVYRPARLAL